MAQGYTQVEGLDFGETYAPVARLAYACAHNIKLYQMDVRVHFSMGTSMSLCMQNNHPVLKMRRSPTMSTS